MVNHGDVKRLAIWKEIKCEKEQKMWEKQEWKKKRDCRKKLRLQLVRIGRICKSKSQSQRETQNWGWGKDYRQDVAMPKDVMQEAQELEVGIETKVVEEAKQPPEFEPEQKA